jgi:hypothetical protein
MEEIPLGVEPVTDFHPFIWLNKWWHFGMECVDYSLQDCRYEF